MDSYEKSNGVVATSLSSSCYQQQAGVPDHSRSEPRRRHPDQQPSAKDDGRVLAVAVFLFVLCSLLQTALRVREEPWDLAFVVVSYASLATLFRCVWRAERLVALAGSSPAAWEERRRLHLRVWALSTALCCAFAYKVSAVMPADLAVIFWCMTWFVALVGFYILVVSKDEGRRAGASEEEHASDANAGNGRGLEVEEIVSADEFVYRLKAS